MDAVIHIVAGIMLGGLVNALADNLPHGRLLARPRYPDGAPRPLVAWLALAAFLFNRRRSPDIGTPGRLGWRYPLTELALAGLLPVTHLAGAQAPLGQQLLWHSYVVVFVLLGILDIEHKRILFWPVIALSALALFDAAVYPQPAPAVPSSLAGGVTGGLVFSLVYAGGQVYRQSFRRGAEMPTAFGKGDVYLMAMGGLVLGFPNVLAAMAATVFLGGGGALTWLLGARLRGQGLARFTALPYGPYILAATYAAMIGLGGVSPGF
ncbi:MAG: prepilin peptidase [Chloroflexi bacterium]|nr:prepilin peptidase [Chloroflexota bacterium]